MPCCGGGGGQRQEPSRGQQSHVPTFHRGGGRGRGRGRVGGNQAPPPAAQPAAFSQFESVPAPEASTSLPRVAPHAASASSSVASLSRDVEERLTLQSPAPTQDLPAFTTPSKASRFPPRPGYGTVGRKCVVRANHLLVEVADRDLHHYDVSITPEVASETVNRVVMTELVSLYRESHLGGRMPAFDGRKGLYTAGPLPFTSKEFAVKLADQNGHTDSTRREREFKVAIKFAARADLRHLQQFLLGRQTDSPQETIQILAVVLKESPSKSYTIVGRSFYSSVLGPTGELGDGLEYWKGYYQSLYPTQMGLSLNIDASARSFYEPILVTEFVAKYFNVRELSGPLSDEDRVKIKRALKGVKVEHTHREYANRYKITGVSTQPMSQLTFSLNDMGAPMSVVQYFREKYNIVLKYAFLPALQSGSDTNPIYFPMELCKIVEGQRCSKKMSDKQVTALLRATCQRPDDRERTINQMVRQNSYSRDLLVREEFGIQVRDELTLVDARVLPPPRLKYHDTGKEANVDPQLGRWNMINKKMVNGGTVELWTCVNFSLLLCEDFVVRFCEELVSMCASKGMVFNSNPLLPIHSAHPDQIEEALLNIHSQSTAKLASVGQEGKQLQLLIIILPDVSGSYGRIKRVCETELGIMSQCCQPTQAQKLNKQYLENVALKINVKVGGRNTVLFDALQRQIPLITDLPTIIFGADVTHPQPWDVSSPSIAGVVASMDWPEMTKYRGLVSAQHHREEIIQDLFKSIRDPQKGMVHGGMVRELLIAFRRSTGHKPHRIIFYRDGVSEGQFSRLLLSEMDAIRQACASLEDGYLPRVTFVVVQKRHNTRLFPGDPNDCNLTDTSGNILPGTVVDTNICHPFEFDFYLNSHAVTQGTSQPTRYRVLYDENNFSADALQTLTNNLCYTYARCTRAVSVVPPVRYAHLAAFRARYYIDGSETSYSGSECGGSSTSDSGSEGWGTGEMNVEVRSLLPIKDNVKDVMFYC